MLGLNLFGPMNNIKLSRKELFAYLAKIGYTEVEPCVSLIGAVHPAFFLPEELLELKPYADALGLKCACAHVNTGDLMQNLPKLVAFAKECGMEKIVLWAPSGLDDAGYQKKVDEYCAAAKALQEIGCELLLHNGWPDIAEKRGGKTAYEWVIDACEGLVGMQFDAGWCQFGKEDPKEIMLRNVEKIRSIHLKDVRGTYENMDPDLSNVGLGTGEVDIPFFSGFAKEHGLPQLADQDRSDTTMEEDLVAAVKLVG